MRKLRCQKDWNLFHPSVESWPLSLNYKKMVFGKPGARMAVHILGSPDPTKFLWVFSSEKKKHGILMKGSQFL